MGNHMRLIDADALAKFIDYGHLNNPNEKLYSENDIREMIDMMPTIAEPVRHGKWKWLSCTYDRVPKEMEYECSECHHKTIVHGDDMPWEKYCPNCGARMDAE